jgi:hypothetical protein
MKVGRRLPRHQTSTPVLDRGRVHSHLRHFQCAMEP